MRSGEVGFKGIAPTSNKSVQLLPKPLTREKGAWEVHSLNAWDVGSLSTSRLRLRLSADHQEFHVQRELAHRQMNSVSWTHNLKTLIKNQTDIAAQPAAVSYTSDTMPTAG